MRRRSMAVIPLLIGLSQPATGPDASAEDVLAAMRGALGGAALDDVRGLRAEGRSSRTVGSLRLTMAIELAVGRPDRFARTERMALAGAGTELVTGFNAGLPIQRATGPDGRPVDVMGLIPAADRARTLAASTATLRAESRLLMLGFFGTAWDGAPQQVRLIGKAQAPDGEAHALELTWPGSPAATLYVDVRSGRPLMVVWRAPDVTSLAVSPADPLAGGALADPSRRSVPDAEHRFYFSDYRPVGRHHWPHRIQRAIGNTTVEDLQLGSIALNPAFDRATFDAER